MYVRDAWWIWCSTRSGVPRINQTYSSYPAGTDILFDATEVSYKSHLLHLHCPSGLYCQLGFRVCHRRSCTIWSTNFFLQEVDLRLRPLRMHWLVWGDSKIVSQKGGIEKTLLFQRTFDSLSSLHHKPLNLYINRVLIDSMPIKYRVANVFLWFV